MRAGCYCSQGLTPLDILGKLRESRDLLQLLLDDPAGVADHVHAVPLCACAASVCTSMMCPEI